MSSFAVQTVVTNRSKVYKESLSNRQMYNALNDFSLFERTPDETGIADAILDIASMIEDNQVADPESCITAIENAACLLSMPVSSSPVPVLSPSVSECAIPMHEDGLPSEETISFLFDGVTQEVVTHRAREESAYQRLAALRERVLARLNFPQG